MLSQHLSAQKITTNANGEKIILYTDGSWRFYEPGDSALIEKMNNEVKVESSKKGIPEKSKEVQSANKSQKPQSNIVHSTPFNTASDYKYNDLLQNPPKYNCTIAYEGVDDYTKKKVTSLKKELFFSYTDKQVAPYLQGKNYINCEAYLSKFATGQLYLQLEISIASKNARVEYGFVKEGALLAVKLLNGEIANLYTSGSDGGVINEKDNETIYRVTLAINKDNQKILQHSLIDSIRFTWSTGFEEYEVLNLDFFQNQINCINKL